MKKRAARRKRKGQAAPFPSGWCRICDRRFRTSNTYYAHMRDHAKADGKLGKRSRRRRKK